jgi:hypothetical protein
MVALLAAANVQPYVDLQVAADSVDAQGESPFLPAVRYFLSPDA